MFNSTLRSQRKRGQVEANVDELGRGGRRTLAITSLAVAMALGILPMFSIGVLAPFLIDDLEISRATLGVLVSVTAGVSAVLSPIAGDIFDRIGDRPGLLAVLATGATSLALMAAAATAVGMAAALALAGLCRAGCNPATNRLITERVPLGRRGWITGVKQTGETVAIVLIASGLPAVALLIGWREALLILAAVAALALVAAIVTIRGTHRPAGRAHASPAERRMPRSIRVLNLYNLLMGAGTGAVAAYLPLYAHQEGGLSVAAAGAVLTATGVVGGVSRLVTSHWSEARWGYPDSLSTLAAVAVASCVILIAAPHVGAAAFWIGAGLWGLGGLGFGAVSMLATMAEAHDASTGRASGLVVFWFSLGFTVAAPAFGWLVDHADSYAPGFWMLAALYAAAAATMLVARGMFRSPPTTSRLAIAAAGPEPQ